MTASSHPRCSACFLCRVTDSGERWQLLPGWDVGLNPCTGCWGNPQQPWKLWKHLKFKTFYHLWQQQNVMEGAELRVLLPLNVPHITPRSGIPGAQSQRPRLQPPPPPSSLRKTSVLSQCLWSCWQGERGQPHFALRRHNWVARGAQTPTSRHSQHSPQLSLPRPPLPPFTDSPTSKRLPCLGQTKPFWLKQLGSKTSAELRDTPDP